MDKDLVPCLAFDEQLLGPCSPYGGWTPGLSLILSGMGQIYKSESAEIPLLQARPLLSHMLQEE